MPEIKELYLNDPSYSSANHTTEFVYLGNATSILYTVYSSSFGDVELAWSIDSENIISTDLYSLNANVSCEINLNIKASYCRFKVYNLASPCSLLIQSFFFLTKKPLKFESSDNSIVISDSPDVRAVTLNLDVLTLNT